MRDLKNEKELPHINIPSRGVGAVDVQTEALLSLLEIDLRLGWCKEKTSDAFFFCRFFKILGV